MEWKDGRELCFKVIDLAKKAGVQQSDVILQRGSSFSLQAQGGKIDKSKVTSTQVVGIRVIQDQKLGISASESLDDASLKRMIQQALDASQYANVDSNQRIDQKNEQDLICAPDHLNQADTAPLQEKVDLALLLEAEVLKQDKRIHNSPYSGYSDGTGEQFYANHLGTFSYQRERSFSCYTSALAAENGAQTLFSASSVSRNFAGLDSQFCVQESVKTALELLKGGPLKTGRYDVIFSADEWENVLGSYLGAFSAKAAMEGIAYYRDKVGASIASNLLSIRDCPRYQDGFVYSLFDAEGYEQKDFSLLEKGILKSLFHNSATARHYKVPNTAHGARGPRSSLGTSPSQLVIDRGTTGTRELYAGNVFKVIGLKGLHSGTNEISGHLSLAAEGFLMKDGEIIEVVKDVTLSGNFYEMLQHIQAVGSEMETSSSRSFFSPAIRFADISIAGG